jgi:hypothetical protein
MRANFCERMTPSDELPFETPQHEISAEIRKGKSKSEEDIISAKFKGMLLSHINCLSPCSYGFHIQIVTTNKEPKFQISLNIASSIKKIKQGCYKPLLIADCSTPSSPHLSTLNKPWWSNC